MRAAACFNTFSVMCDRTEYFVQTTRHERLLQFTGMSHQLSGGNYT